MFVKIAKAGSGRKVTSVYRNRIHIDSTYDEIIVNTKNISFIDCSQGLIYMKNGDVIESEFAISDSDLEEWGLIEEE